MDNLPEIAYLVRKTSLTLEQIGKLDREQFAAIFEEVQFQENQAEWVQANYLANIVAAIANTVPRRSKRVYKAKDFLEISMPTRGGERKVQEDLSELAKKFGIKLPGKKLLDFIEGGDQ